MEGSKSKKMLVHVIALIVILVLVGGGFAGGVYYGWLRFGAPAMQQAIEASNARDREAISYCTQDPYSPEIGIGGEYYPVDPKYGNLNWLGQLFTADDCGGERVKELMMVNGDNYTFGSAIWLKDNPSQSLINILKSIGYTCGETTNENICKKWELNETVKVKDLLKLKPYYEEFQSDDCRNCG